MTRRNLCPRFCGLCIEHVDITHEHQSLEITLPQPGLGGSLRLDDRAQLIWVASQDNIGVLIRERCNRDHRKGFFCLCSLIDDDVAEVPDRNIPGLKHTC